MNEAITVPVIAESRALALAPVFAGEQTGPDNILLTYLRLLLRRKWLILGCIVAGAVIAVLMTMTTVKLYRASAQLEIDREAAQVVEQKGVEPPATVGAMEFYQTQYGLLHSRALAQLVVRRLRLYDNPEFLFGYVGGGKTAATPEAPRDKLEERATGMVLANTTVAPVRGSGLVEVSFASPDPVLSAKVANTLADSFIQSNLDRRYQQTDYARRFLENQLNILRVRLEASERKVVAYANQQGLIDFQEAGANGQPGTSQPMAALNLQALNDALLKAKSDRIALQSSTQSQSSELQRTLSDPAVSAMRQSRADLQAQLAKLLVQFKPDYPQVQALQQQVHELDRQIAAQTGTVKRSVSADYSAAIRREADLQGKVNAAKGALLNERERSIQYNILQREADTNREQYQALLQRYKEVGVAAGVGVNNVSIVDRAEVPGAPFKPRPMLNLLLGLLLGAGAGIAITLLLAQLDESLAAPDEVTQKLGVPLLGSIPRISDGFVLLDELRDQKSLLSEAYYSLSTSLRFSTNHGVPRTMLVTSARAAEGKTSTTIATARNLARLYGNALLIDGDLRRPSVHNVLGLDNARGFSDALAGEEDLFSLVQQSEGGLSVITSGMVPPNPVDLLAGDRLAQVLDRLSTRFSHIVIDGPPILGLADAPLISNVVEGCIFVIAAGETGVNAASGSIARLNRARAHVLGVVLTKFDAKRIGYDYGYSYEYGAKA